MEKSLLYKLLETTVLRDFREQLEQEDEIFIDAEREALAKAELLKNLLDEHKHLVDEYSSAVENRLGSIHSELCVKTLNLGIKIGMELQKAFEECDEI